MSQNLSSVVAYSLCYLKEKIILRGSKDCFVTEEAIMLKFTPKAPTQRIDSTSPFWRLNFESPEPFYSPHDMLQSHIYISKSITITTTITSNYYY